MSLWRKVNGSLIITPDSALVDCSTCPCATNYQLTVRYDWGGTGQLDLDTCTQVFGEQVGYGCANIQYYARWIPRVEGDSSGDDQSLNGYEQVDIRVDDARRDAQWTSSVNIDCYAGWYTGAGGSGPALLSVSYRARTKTKSIAPGTQSGCACSSTRVATITAYATPQLDGSFFDLL